MHTLTIFYDAGCGLCGRFRRWMLGQESLLRLEFLPFDSTAALERLPELPALHPDRDLVVMNEEGEIWRGAPAWVMCLWALREGRPWARRLARPVLLPMAATLCGLVSENRLSLSRLMRLHSDREIARQCDQHAGGCRDACPTPGFAPPPPPDSPQR